MGIASQIEQILTESLAPEKLELINESHLHAGHAGDNGSGESHFRVIVVSGRFAGLNRIARHRMVFAILQEKLETMPHALSLKAFAPDEV
ncbi:MAG: BolA family transcriptional regulator [Rhodospirillales bacterium]|nr:BolA family transcriptional regulator [Rhodospirillales bacterium]MCB9995901.1 BolA family transcriptional regulator [Rhodospirillales bacterium]